MANRKPLYYSPENEGFEQIDISNDSISASGFIFKDTEFFISLNDSNNIVFNDGVSGKKNLSELANQIQVDDIQNQIDSINNTISSFNVIDGGSPSSLFGGIEDIDGGTP